MTLNVKKVQMVSRLRKLFDFCTFFSIRVAVINLLISCGNESTLVLPDFVGVVLEAKHENLPSYLRLSQSESDDFLPLTERSVYSLSPANETIQQLSAQVPSEAFVFVVSGCSTGYAPVIRSRSASLNFKLFRLDEGCVISLRSFVRDGVAWTKRGGGDFSGPGEVEFVAGPHRPPILVKNPSNLSRVVSAADKVVFDFKVLDIGNHVYLFKTGERGEVKSIYNSRPGPYLQWPRSRSGISLSKDKLRFYLECMGQLSVFPNVRDSECLARDSNNVLVRQSLSDYYFLVSQGRADRRPDFRSLVFSFMTHWGQKVLTIRNQEQIWYDKASGRGGVFVDLPMTSANEKLFESNCPRLLILNKTRASRVGHWAFTWLNFGLGYAGQSCLQESDPPDDYHPDYEDRID